MQESDGRIQSRISEHVGRLILNRPDSHNAISKKMWLDIPAHLRKLQDKGVRLVLIEGVGGSFAAGADLHELKNLTGPENARNNWDAIAQALSCLHSYPLPTIAAIDGPCLGGGCLLAAACDLRYASKRAKFSVPIARLGIVLDDVNLGRLAALVGLAKAKELVFRACVIDAEEAQKCGLVNAVFAESEFNQAVSGLVGEIVANSAVSIKEAKASFARVEAFSPGHPDNERMVVSSYLDPEFKERLGRATRKK